MPWNVLGRVVLKSALAPEAEDLGLREWTCSECNTAHHRDVNAAENILAAGHGRLAGGIPALAAQAAALQG